MGNAGGKMERFRSQCVDMMPHDNRSSLEKACVSVILLRVSALLLTSVVSKTNGSAHFAMISNRIDWPSTTLQIPSCINPRCRNTHGVYVCRAREYAYLSSDRWRLLSTFGILPRVDGGEWE